jgi:hypothetical protein
MGPKAYFPVGDFDHLPDDSIKLGQIFLDLERPDVALCLPLEPLPETSQSYKDNWEEERSRTFSGSIGIWAQFLALILGLGGNVAANLEREDSNVLRFTKLETTYIKPALVAEYVAKSMASGAIQDHLKRNPKTTTAFMITGVKVVRGAEVSNRRGRGFGGDGMVGVGIPGGPTASIQRHVVNHQSFTGSSDFVFAYRLRKITLQRKHAQFKSADHVKGAIYHLDERSTDVPRDLKKESGDAYTTKEETTKGFDISADIEDFGLDFIPSEFQSTPARDEENEQDCRLLFLAQV